MKRAGVKRTKTPETKEEKNPTFYLSNRISKQKPMATRAGLKEQEQPKQNMASNIAGILTGKQTK